MYTKLNCRTDGPFGSARQLLTYFGFGPGPGNGSGGGVVGPGVSGFGPGSGGAGAGVINLFMLKEFRQNDSTIS